jgi:hypothetical protein
MRILAALALLMHLCWPFVGQLRAAEPKMVQVLCTVHGVMLVPAEEAPDTSTSKPACALCASVSVALTNAIPAPAAAEAAPERGAVLAASPAPQRALYPSTRPRAPPVLS